MKSAALALLPILLLSTGCRESEVAPAPTPPPEPELPRTVTFTDTNEVVAAEEIVVAEKSKSITADLNLDGLQAVVVIEGTPEGKERVSIYIRKPTPPASDTPEGEEGATAKPVFDVDVVSFYRAGVIHPLSSGKIIGLMTRRGHNRHTDILLVVAHANGQNEIVHYHNEGTRFVMAN